MTTEPKQYVLELRAVGRQFGSDPVVHALRDVDLGLERGEWLAITGGRFTNKANAAQSSY